MSTFPGAGAARSTADYVILGAPLDVSASFRPGARFGPGRVRRFATPFEDYDHHTGRRFSDLAVHDAGDLRAWDDAAEYLAFLEDEIADVRADGAVPLLVGGEHTVAVAGVRACRPDVYVCLDAHLDLREALDGNPLSHATVTRHALSVADEAVLLGARTGAAAEWERADGPDVTVVAPDDVADWVAEHAGRPDDAALGDGDVYLSVDVDVTDPGFAPGTGTPEPFGLDPPTVRDAVRALAPDAVGFDVVEVNDRDDGQAPALAAKLLRAFVFAHAEASRR